MRPTALWHQLTAPTTEGDLARRQEAVLLNILAGGGVLSIGTQVLQLLKAAGSTGWVGLAWWGVNLGFFAGVVGLMALARSGRHRTAASILIGVLGGLAFAVLLAGGINNSMWSVVLGLCVVLAAVLLSGRTALWVSVAGGAAAALVGILIQTGTFEPLGAPPGPDTAAADAFGILAVLGFLAAVCIVYVRDVGTSVNEILTHDAEDSPLRDLRTSRLSVREVEVVRLVAEGLQDKEIAARLLISTRTVHSHLVNARAKTGAPNRTALGILAVVEGLVPRERILALAPPDNHTDALRSTGNLTNR